MENRRRKPLARRFVVPVLFLLPVLLPVLLPAQAAGQHVLLISIDGLMPDYYLRAAELGLEIPNLALLMREGSYAERAEGIFPTVTFPTHASIITGVHPARHKILNNRVFDPDGSLGGGWHWFYEDLKARTLFDAAREAGLTTAAVTWPVTVGAPLDMIVPDFYPNEHLFHTKVLRAVSHGEGLDEVLPTSEDLVHLKDDLRTRIATHFIRSKPNFLAVHFLEFDSALHSHGPLAPPTFQTLEKIDRYLGEIFDAVRAAGIWDSTTIIVVSDHGFLETRRIVRPGALLAALGLIEVDEQGKVLSWQAFPWSASGSLAIYVHPDAPVEAREKVDSIVQLLLSRPEYGVERAYSGETLQDLAGFDDAYVVLEARKGFWLSGSLQGELVVETAPGGTHGYSPARPEMSAAFLIRGPGIKKSNRLPEVRLIDVAPTLARILGVQLGEVDGRVLDEIFR